MRVPAQQQDDRPMSDTTHPPVAPVTPRAGDSPYVTLNLSSSADTPFLLGRQTQRTGSAVMVSVASHLGTVLLFLVLSRILPTPLRNVDLFPDRENPDLIWLDQAGPGGGGGGGGNQQLEPPRQLETPGRDRLAVPVVKPPELEAPPKPDVKEAPPIEQLNIPVVAMNSGDVVLPGALQGIPDPTLTSLGPGSGGGAGTGRGTGIGPGSGSGLGPGSGGGSGGGEYRPGSGVSTPRVLREVRPQYTADALRAKIQGTVMVDCVVLPDGTVGRVEVIKSLDGVFGLDQEAVKAAKQWRFSPGMRQGVAVSVLVTIELTFNLR